MEAAPAHLGVRHRDAVLQRRAAIPDARALDHRTAVEPLLRPRGPVDLHPCHRFPRHLRPWRARSAPPGAAVTLVVHEHKRLGRGIELAALAEQLKAAGIALEFLTGELQGSHDPSGVVFTVLAALSGMEREYIRDRTLEGHESAPARGKSIGGAAVVDEAMLAMALHLRENNHSLRDIAARLVISRGKKKGQHPSPATVLWMLRDHDHAAQPTSP
nr:recombinase family protein [Nocardia alba]